MTTWNIDSPTTEYFDHNSAGVGALLQELEQVDEIALDTETTGLNVWRDVPLYWSIAWEGRRATLNTSVLQLAQRGTLFSNPDRRWIFANAKYDTHMLANVGVNVAGSLVDIQVQHALLYDDRRHGLKDINQHLFDWKWADFEDTFGKIGKRQSAEDRIRKAEAENFDLLVEYAANDAWGTWQAYLELSKQLRDAQTYSLFMEVEPYITTLHDLFEKIEVPYTKVLWKNERNGCLVDKQYLAEIEPVARQEIEKLERDICAEAGQVINPNSTPQLREYLFNKVGLQPIKQTKGGKTGVTQPSLDKSTLEKFAAQNKVAALVMEYRKLTKLYGTYITGIGALLDSHDRVHTRYNQDIARTGRLTSADPNLQNIPNSENDKWNLRGAFIAGPGNKLLTADYEQLEMRLLAAASLEPGMIEVVQKGWDIHMGNASMIFGFPYEDIKEAKKIDKMVDHNELPASALTDYHRKCLAARAAAKTIGFGLVYGMGPEKLGNALKISKAEAEEKIATFMQKYPAVESFKEDAINETYQTGYSFTILGRRRNVPQIASNRYSERMQGERIAVNCVDYETEALTQRGWLKGSDVTHNDYLLAYNIEKDTLFWEQVTDVKHFPDYSGPITSIESKTFSAKTTPNHRWAIYNKATKSLECKLTSELSRHGDHRILRAAKRVLGEPPEKYSRNLVLSQHKPDHLALIGWFLTDGFICKKAKPTHSQRVGLRQSQRAKPENVKMIDELLGRLGIKASRTTNKNEYTYWYFIGLEAEELVALFPDRVLTSKFVATLRTTPARLLMDTMMLGDGNYTKEAADAFQALAAVAGHATTSRFRDMSGYTPASEKMENVPRSGGCYYVTVLNRDKVQVQGGHVTESNETCPVWCPVVPSTYFMARRNGKVYITGNTQIQGSAADVVKMAQILLDRAQLDRRFDCHSIMQVHDELTHECPAEAAEEAMEEIQGWMQHPFIHELGENVGTYIPLNVDINSGQSWMEAK